MPALNLTVPSTTPTPINFGVENFKPWYTAQEMLIMGVHGGAFFFRLASLNGIKPEYLEAIPYDHMRSMVPDLSINMFKVDGNSKRFGLDMPVSVKQKNPYGWFQWYTKLCDRGQVAIFDEGYNYWFYMWKTTILNLWYYIENGTYTGGSNKYTDLTFLPEIRQGLLEFGWDSTKKPGDYGIY